MSEVLSAFAGYGIEIEYMLVDRASLDIRPIADELLRAAAGRYVAEVERDGMGWSNELALHLVEVKNLRPKPDLAELLPAFQGEVEAIDARLAAEGAQLMPGGMHPWMDPARQTRLWTRSHAAIYRSYDRIFDCRRHGWANIQSMHLNLPFADDREFARLHAAMRLALPILPALAASSPFADGRYTGFMDYRLEMYRDHQREVPETMGEVVPEDSASRVDYEAEVLLPIYRAIAEHDIEGALRHEWLNARGAIPRFERNAIEIRVLDAQECPLADLAVAAATAALVRRLYDSPPATAPKTPALAALLRASIHDAEQARIDDEAYLRVLGHGGGPCTAGELWAELLAGMFAGGEVAPLWREPLQLILDQGPLARRLLATVGADAPMERLQSVYRQLCRCLHEGRMYRPPA